VRPRLDPAVLPRLYSSDYFDSAVDVGYRDYARQARRRRREAWFLDRWLRRHPPRGPVLEVGCALGFLLAALRDKGHEVAGIDVSRFAAGYATKRLGLDVRAATLDEAAFAEGTFACVVQKDLLEHVVDPQRHLRETCRILRPGGWLWVVTPNGEANLRPLEAAARRAPARDVLPLVDQSHLSFFAPEHLRRLFDACGFEVVRARTIGVRRGLRALGWLPGQARFARLVPRPAEPGPAGEALEDDSRFDALARQIEQEIAARRKAPESALLHRLHRASKWIDELPGAVGVGYDFEFLLRRR
jgi:2-polyprenyl-3-methyl-5-hydroxy-6-metoxy-1,4-benzoquinol methylase